MGHQVNAAGQAIARADGKFQDVPIAAGRKGFKTELGALRERMRTLGFSYDEIAAEIGRRYRTRPREAYRLAWGWTLEQAAARFNERAARQGADPDARASLNHSRLSEFEHWPRSSRKPSVYVLFMLAEIYETDVLCLLDLADHESLPQQDRLVLMRRPRAATPFGEKLVALMEARGLSLRETARRVPCDASYLSKIVHGHKSVSSQVELAGLAGLSYSYISMIECGQRKLTRRDHVNALAAALRVPPAEIVPSISPGFDEWAPAPPAPALAFPPVTDDIAAARHRELAAQFMRQVRAGDTYAAGAWLRRLARDPSVNPWLLLDQLTALDMTLPSPRPLGGSAARLVSADSTGRGRAG